MKFFLALLFVLALSVMSIHGDVNAQYELFAEPSIGDAPEAPVGPAPTPVSEPPTPVGPAPTPVAPVPVAPVYAQLRPVSHCWQQIDNVKVAFFGYVNSGIAKPETAASFTIVGGTTPSISTFLTGDNFMAISSNASANVVTLNLDGSSVSIDTSASSRQCPNTATTFSVVLNAPIEEADLKNDLSANIPYPIGGISVTDLSAVKRASTEWEITLTPQSGSISPVAAAGRVTSGSAQFNNFAVESATFPSGSIPVENVVAPATPTPSGLSDGAIAGIVVGSVLGGLLLIGLIIFVAIKLSSRSGGSAKPARQAAPASTKAASKPAAAAAAAPDSSEEDSEEEDSEEDSEEEDSEEEDSEEEDSEEEDSEEEESEEEESEEEESENSEEESSEVESSEQESSEEESSSE